MTRRPKPTRRVAEVQDPAIPPEERATLDDARRDHASSEGAAHSSPLEKEIRLRAYYRYLEREGAAGDEMSDWLEAESDVLNRHATGVDVEEKVTDEGAA
jgi:hypothetical protein